MLEDTVKVREKGEITIPIKIRESANIVKGDVLKIDYENGNLILSHYRGKDK